MKMLVVVVPLILSALALLAHGVIYNIDEAEPLFEKFMLDFNKQYSSEDEKIMRFSVFKKTLEKVNEQNKKHNTDVFGITFMSDLTEEETKMFRNPRDSVCNNDGCPSEDIDDVKLPDHFDWRDQGKVSPIKNQGQCGSCWAFGTIAAIESQLLINNKTLTLSEKQVMDCNSYNYKCDNGGCENNAFRYFIKNGIMSDKDYPYSPTDGDCNYDASKVVAKISKCVSPKANGSLDKLKQALIVHGPLSVGVNGLQFSTYTTGILPCENLGVDHAVLLVGYGKENGKDYLLLKNSWGPVFGEKGFIKIGGEENKDNPCNILDNDPIYPVVV